MNTLELFLTYAADFEKTLVDDEWSRLAQYFAKDAVYRVEADSFGCELTGHDAIFAGMKKSLDGFDRHFREREIDLTEGPDVENDELRVSWTVTYHRDEQPDFLLRGKSRAQIRNGKISLLVDSYDERVNTELAAWTNQTGLKLDPSYT